MTETSFEPESLPLLAALPTPCRARLLERAVVHSVTPGTILFEQGETPNFQIIVLAGSVQLMGRSSAGREVLIEAVAPPDLIIPAAVLTASPYLLRACAPEASRLLMIQAETFRAAALHEPALAQAVIGSLSGQFRRMVRQIKNLKLRSVAERTGCYLLGLARQQGTPHQAVLPYSKQLIASELGMTRESFSRTLSALQTDGISVEGDLIRIHDPARLAAACKLDPLIDGPEAMAPFDAGNGLGSR